MRDVAIVAYIEGQNTSATTLSPVAGSNSSGGTCTLASTPAIPRILLMMSPLKKSLRKKSISF